MTIVESISSDLKELSNAKLLKVARFVRELEPDTETLRRQREALDRTFGCLDEETGRIFDEALAGSRQIPDEDPS